MGPADIKEAMRSHLQTRAPGALVIDELGLDGGSVIADVALVTEDLFAGYEIKSAADNVKRLPNQVAVYSRVFDRCAVVTDPKHLTHAEPLLPPWWGIVLVEDGRLFLLRELHTNPQLDLPCLLRLLWRDELVSELSRTGDLTGLRTARKAVLAKKVLQTRTPDEVRALVRKTLRERENWLADDGRRKLGR